MAGDSPPSFSERLGVTVFAPWTDLGATTNRVPRRVRPLDEAPVAHDRSSLPDVLAVSKNWHVINT